MSNIQLVELLSLMVQEGITLLSLQPGSPPAFIRDGKTLENLDHASILTASDCARLIQSVLYDAQRSELEKKGRLVATFHVVGKSSFYIEARFKQGAYSATLKTFEKLKRLPDAVTKDGFHIFEGFNAWKGDQLPRALRVLSQLGIATLSCTAVLIEGKKISPLAEGSWEWTVEERPGEEWSAFCLRSAEEAIQAVATAPVKANVHFRAVCIDRFAP